MAEEDNEVSDSSSSSDSSGGDIGSSGDDGAQNTVDRAAEFQCSLGNFSHLEHPMWCLKHSLTRLVIAFS